MKNSQRRDETRGYSRAHDQNTSERSRNRVEYQGEQSGWVPAASIAAVVNSDMDWSLNITL